MNRRLGTLFFVILVLAFITAATHADTTFRFPPIGGMIMSADQQTLIVSVPSQGKLVYIDTLAEKQLKEVEVDFQPTLLAVQGKQLFVGSKGTSKIFALDADSAKSLKEFSVPGEPLQALSCHPTSGLLYAVNLQNEVFSIDPETGKSTKTKAKGQLLAVDPSNPQYVYTGVQKPINDVLVIQDLGNEIRVSLSQANIRALMLKYKADGAELTLMAANDNAAINGRGMGVSGDGKQVAMAGGGGWRSKTDPHVSYSIAVFDAETMTGVNGQIETGAYPGDVTFHPVLKLGAATKITGGGDELTIFNAKSLVKKEGFKATGHSSNHSGYLTFGGKGTKVIYASHSGTVKEEAVLQIFSLKLSEDDRALLKKAYGDSPQIEKGN